MPVGEVAASQLTLQMVPDYPPGPTELAGGKGEGTGRRARAKLGLVSAGWEDRVEPGA